MCGICGIVNVNKDDSVDKDILVRMRDVMTHRGPDDDGIYLSNNVGLGFRRLSIVDLSTGHQPIANESGDIWLIFNGEIYNHRDLRKDLISKGHHYKTKSDTESIVHLYEEEDLEGFKKMNGMFGIAIWDNRKKRLVLVRDRLGIKPIYYHISERGFVFASEIKSIIESKYYHPEINSDGLEEYFIFRFVAGEKTMFKGIYSLLPGHILTIENGKLQIRKFWDLPDQGETKEISDVEAAAKLGELLQASIKYRLMSDVPLGTFCSGGVDSSLTSAYAAQLSTQSLNTFSVGFQEKEFDESKYALMVSQKFNTRHHTITVDNKTFADFLPKMIWFNDEPINHANSVQIYLISKLAKQFVTVVLTGEGSDELFGGYPRYLISKAYSRLQGLPGFSKTMLSKIAQMGNMRKLNKLAQVLPLGFAEMAVLNSSFINRDLANSVLSASCSIDFFKKRLSLLSGRKLDRDNLTETIMLLDLKTYLVSILNRQDKMSMAASIEARVPFLDHRIVEWATTIPLNLKINGLSTKQIVKNLASSLLPQELINRKKSGFGVPISNWLRDKEGLGRYLNLFYEGRYSHRGYINSGKVRAIASEHLSRKADHGELLWELINLELWHRIYLEGEDFELFNIAK